MSVALKLDCEMHCDVCWMPEPQYVRCSCSWLDNRIRNTWNGGFSKRRHSDAGLVTLGNCSFSIALPYRIHIPNRASFLVRSVSTSHPCAYDVLDTCSPQRSAKSHLREIPIVDSEQLETPVMPCPQN